MPSVLVGTTVGCRVFNEDGEGPTHFPNRLVLNFSPDGANDCLALVDGTEIWRRYSSGQWSFVASSGIFLQSIMRTGGTTFGGSMQGAQLYKIYSDRDAEQVAGFDRVEGRENWFPEGPPLHVRALTATADSSAILAAVHVGGIPRSTDGGVTWAPTVPIDYDVHEVSAHPNRPEIVAAAAAVGLCLSHDSGASWACLEGLEITDSLAVAVLDDEVIFSTQEGGPFAKRSQLWRCQVSGGRPRLVSEGLPEWLEGKIDTAHIAASKSGWAAVLDKGGNLWKSQPGLRDWKRIATGFVLGVFGCGV